jgi:hypothetical protein
MSESIVQFKRLENQNRILKWKIWSVMEWKCSRKQHLAIDTEFLLAFYKSNSQCFSRIVEPCKVDRWLSFWKKIYVKKTIQEFACLYVPVFYEYMNRGMMFIISSSIHIHVQIKIYQEFYHSIIYSQWRRSC